MSKIHEIVLIELTKFLTLVQKQSQGFLVKYDNLEISGSWGGLLKLVKIHFSWKEIFLYYYFVRKPI